MNKEQPNREGKMENFLTANQSRSYSTEQLINLLSSDLSDKDENRKDSRLA
jgi:hypothetical protein